MTKYNALYSCLNGKLGCQLLHERNLDTRHIGKTSAIKWKSWRANHKNFKQANCRCFLEHPTGLVLYSRNTHCCDFPLACVGIYLCVCVCASVSVRLYVCQREREREREGGGERVKV
jgi:hypothetical protein